MRQKIKLFEEGGLDFYALVESCQGWQAHAKWANTYKLRKGLKNQIIQAVWNKL
ncbi:MAG: hypothetical protein KKE05_02790 [Nanoarchaeota archaeon]|nr:hypothetical protein [Nanoarchaeota archaeon]